jgi:hypothetical protein
MPNAAIVAAALTDHSAHPYSLWVGGVDMIRQPIAGGNAYGVPIDTVEVTENGPGGVSSMRFEVEDPLKVLPIPSAGQEVILWNRSSGVDLPEFGGYVQAIDVRPHEGQQGRWFEVTCVGYEILLDWTIVPLLTVNFGDKTVAVSQLIAAAAGLRSALQSGGAGQGNQATPIAGLLGTQTVNGFDESPHNISGTTLRELLRLLWANTGTIQAFITVDFFKGLRIWTLVPDDYSGISLLDASGSLSASASLHYTFTPVDVIRNVTIIGGGGYIGTFSDGSGITGPGAVISDSTITTSVGGQTAATAYLGALAPGIRGTLHVQNSGYIDVRAGAVLTLQDASVGLPADTNFTIYSFVKHYNSDASQELDIQFGGLAPSLSRSVRRLTRATLS